MKKLLLTTTAIFFALSLMAQKSKVKGTASYIEPVSKVYLSYSANGKRVSDSTELKNGTFGFNVNISEPTQAMIMVRFKEHDGKVRNLERTQLYLERGTILIKIKDSVKNAIITGSKSQKESELLSGMVKPYNEKSNTLRVKYSIAAKNKDEEEIKKVNEEFEKNNADMRENVFRKFLTTHPNSYVSLSVLNELAGYDLDPAIVEPMFNGLSKNLRNSNSGKEFAKKIEVARKTAVGATAMDFTQNDTLDKPVSLSDFRGKYVLIDFWASWCGPCRAENPNVVKAFNKYKGKNFTVLGVSLDQEGKKQAWMDAIHKDNLTWTQVSDLKFWDNAVAKKWGIRAIPQNFLIDPSGKIIAKNIRGEKLIEKLAEILD